jgi:AcrR family transcriptional regulator
MTAVTDTAVRRITKRARNREAKDERRNDILRAALALFAEHPYDKVTMAALARRTGLAKGTVYLYFDTKEAVFLALLIDQLDDWFSVLRPRLREMASEGFVDRLPDVFAQTMSDRPALIRLTGLLHTTLERNIDVELARDFKRRLATLMQGPGQILENRIDRFGPGDGSRLLMRMHALTVGLGQMANPSDSVAEAIADPDLLFFRVDFERELGDVLRMLLRGWDRAA